MVAAGTAIGLVWAGAPRHRKQVLFEAPIALEPGATVSGTFLPEHEGPIAISLRFPRDGRFEELAALIGGVWALSAPRPMGLSISFARHTAEGAHNPMVPIVAYEGGSFGADTVAVGFGWFPNTPVVTGFDVRIDAAAAGLRAFHATFVVAAAGDWANYAHLEAVLRLVAVASSATVALLVIGIVRVISSRRFTYRTATSG